MAAGLRAAMRLAFTAALCALSPVDAAGGMESPPVEAAGYSLAKIDPLLRVAVVRVSDGSMEALRKGQSDRAGRLRITRIYADRVEAELSVPGRREAVRLWMQAPGNGRAAWSQPISAQGPPRAPLPADTATVLATVPGR